ncbi:hypothetical protein CY34DRAFT_812750 [Suillus luteus UH-Slu-Lm8-n1]|uniref:BAG domain-containing protein n=1 Tax=Suillus luteus UH-Slu-Lm8-n1 TaxID=930992 RepID=A0A0D0AK93_9AGAM|nr:hypothetical protein CY34DRAFT_812750 [Suillus luteus UH-Slu-Lm8-n1]
MPFTIPLGLRFPSCSSIARQQAEFRALFTISTRPVSESGTILQLFELTSRSHNSLLAAIRMPGTLRDPSVLSQSEHLLKDMIVSHFMEEHRLMAEHQSEVHNALQAILAHLSEDTTVKTPTESDPATSPTATSTTAVDVNEEGPIPLQKGNADSDTPEEPSASPANIASSPFQISSITARLETLLATFQFPAELDFSPALETADVFALTYTPANSPVLTQAHALSLLFADLDNVPSFGSDVVRNARRAAVIRVDQALQKLDEGVEERRGRARAKKADPVTVPVDQPAHPNDGEPLEDVDHFRESSRCRIPPSTTPVTPPKPKVLIMVLRTIQFENFVRAGY